MSLNKVLLIGVVGKDPQVRHLETGIAVVTLSIATSESFKDKNGETKVQTDWHNVIFWRQLAQIVERDVRKGSHIYVEGKLQNRSWEDSTGQKKYTVQIVAETLRLLSSKGNNNNAQQNYQISNDPPAKQELDDITQVDDLPF